MKRLIIKLLGVIFFVFLVGSVPVFAATVSWDGGGVDSDWCTDDNWSNDVEPTSGDDVTIDVAVTVTTSGCVTEANELDFNTLIVGGSNAAILEIEQDIGTGGSLTIASNGTVRQQAATGEDYPDQQTISGDLTIQSGGTLTHAGTGVGSGTYEKVDFNVGGDLDVQSGGVIYVDGLGYLGGYVSPNNSFNGRTEDNWWGSAGHSGGSHGGRGGKYNDQYAVGEAYDSILNPTLPGGGGGSDYISGNNGGGVVRITATNITVSGDITANGDSANSRGGGAGGTVYLNANGTISGSGAIEANGSVGTSVYGGGGGGRVALHYGSYTHLGTLTACGGDSDSVYEDGAAGTIFKKSSSQNYGDLIIYNCDADQVKYTTSLLETVPDDDKLLNEGYAFNSVAFNDSGNNSWGILNIPSAIDSVSDGGVNVDRKFFCENCPVDDDIPDNGEIVWEAPTLADGVSAGWDGVVDYVCFAPSGFVPVAEFRSYVYLVMILVCIAGLYFYVPRFRKDLFAS